MPTVVTIDTRAQRKKRYRTALPSRSRRRRRASLTRVGARVSAFEGIVGSLVSAMDCFIIKALCAFPNSLKRYEGSGRPHPGALSAAALTDGGNQVVVLFVLVIPAPEAITDALSGAGEFRSP